MEKCFAIWSGNQCSDICNRQDESVSPGTESLNLYASWKLIEFTIQYDPQGGQMDRPSIQYTSDKTGELTWFAGESVWKEGYAFKGWFPNTEYNEDERVTTFR